MKDNTKDMLQKIKNLLIVLIAPLMFALPLAMPSIAAAAGDQNVPTNDLACTGSYANLDTSTGTNCTTTGSSDLSSIIVTVIKIFSVVVGAISVVMIIIGGFRYVTSGGNDQNVSGAKNTIIFALVGLVIVILAQVIVHFVVGQLPATPTAAPPTTGS